MRPGGHGLRFKVLLAAGAAMALVGELGATVVGSAFVLELSALGGRARLPDPVYAAITY